MIIWQLRKNTTEGSRPTTWCFFMVMRGEVRVKRRKYVPHAKRIDWRHVQVHDVLHAPTPPKGGTAALPQGRASRPSRGDLVSFPPRLRRFWKRRSLAFLMTPQYGYTSLQFRRLRILVFRAFVCGFDRLQISLAAPLFTNKNKRLWQTWFTLCDVAAQNKARKCTRKRSLSYKICTGLFSVRSGKKKPAEAG